MSGVCARSAGVSIFTVIWLFVWTSSSGHNAAEIWFALKTLDTHRYRCSCEHAFHKNITSLLNMATHNTTQFNKPIFLKLSFHKFIKEEVHSIHSTTRQIVL